MIRLNVFIQVDAAHRDAVLEAAKALTACSLKDAGCVAYDIFESSTRPDVLLICETWADAPSLSAHSASDHFKKYVGQIEQLGTMKLEQFDFCPRPAACPPPKSHGHSRAGLPAPA